MALHHCLDRVVAPRKPRRAWLLGREPARRAVWTVHVIGPVSHAVQRGQQHDGPDPREQHDERGATALSFHRMAWGGAHHGTTLTRGVVIPKHH